MPTVVLFDVSALRFGLPANTQVTLYRPRAGLPGKFAGYKGRTGVYELVLVDDAMRKLIHEGASEAVLEAEARKRTPSMSADGWAKCVAGITSVDEVLRVTRED